MDATYQEILQAANTNGQEETSAPFRPSPAATAVQVYVYSADAGTVDIDILMSDGRWREVHSASVAAATLLVININWSPPRLQARFTPTASTGSVLIDAGYSGVR